MSMSRFANEQHGVRTLNGNLVYVWHPQRDPDLSGGGKTHGLCKSRRPCVKTGIGTVKAGGWETTQSGTECGRHGVELTSDSLSVVTWCVDVMP